MPTRCLPTTDVRIGMFVVELDRPWLGTPFAFQGFQVRSDVHLDAVRRYCKSVVIDEDLSVSEDEAEKHALSAQRQALRGTTTYEIKRPVEEEFPVARQSYQAFEKVTEELLQTFRRSGEVDADSLRESVASMTASVQRNPNAALLLNMVQDKQVAGDQRLIRRAIDTSVWMLTLGRFLQYGTARMEVLGLAGLLLDVGNVRMPRDLLNSHQALTPAQLQVVRRHVEASLDLIARAEGIPSAASEIVAQHHERQDGSGYPSGLTAEAISIDGAIAGLVDTFSAMTNVRPYAASLSPSNALSAIYKLRNSLFHEALIEQFIQCVGVYPVGSAVQLNTGEIGLVVAQNMVRRLQPRVMLMIDAQGRTLTAHKSLDLTKEPRTRDGAPYRIVKTVPVSNLPINPADFFVA